MQTVIAFPEKPENPEKFNKAPLDLVMCEDCKLIQLRHSFNKDMLYREYWYQSGISPTMVKALRELADKATGLAKLKEDDIVIDIGSNDGTLLSGYPDYVKRVGFEPSNVAKLPEKGKSFLIRDFFNAKSYSSTMTEKAKVITACAMFYDLEDPNTFVHDIKECLDKNGIFIIQMNYLGSMITNKTYDDICMEHDEYYSIAVLERLLDMHELRILDAELNSVNGGSIRAYITHKENNLVISGGAQRLHLLKLSEASLKLDDINTYKEFARSLEANKRKTLDFINKELRKGKKFNISGASTRGLTQMQFLGLDKKQIMYVEDANPRKWGKYYADTGISIIDPRKDTGADYKIVLPYHFIDQIRENQRAFLERGGKLITIIPEFRVIG